MPLTFLTSLTLVHAPDALQNLRWSHYSALDEMCKEGTLTLFRVFNREQQMLGKYRGPTLTVRLKIMS